MKKGIRGAFSGLALLCMMMALTALAHADDGSQLAQAILDATNRYAAASEPPLAEDQKAHLESAASAIVEISCYQVSIARLNEALEPAFVARKALGPVDRESLVHLGLQVLVDLIGHGAALWTVEQMSAPKTTDEPHMSEMREGPMRIISISRFNSATHGECAGALNDTGSDPYEGIVLDLRGNEGGLLSSIVSMSSQFLEPETEIFHLEPSATLFKTSRCNPSYADVPLVVVIDAKTDSGALLLAAVLQDHRRAKIIGRVKDQPSGTIHTLWPSPSRRFALKLPSNELVHAENRRLSDGIAVDVEADVTDDRRMIEIARSVLGL